MTLQQRFHAWLAGNPDDAILRWLFRTVVTVTLAVLATDLATTSGWLRLPEAVSVDGTPGSREAGLPTLPSVLPSVLPAVLAPLLPGGDRQSAPLPTPDGAMAKPMTFDLVGGGRMIATGTITPGIAEVFAAEIAKRGDYVKTVVLNSPGGSVNDALAMGRLIRERKLATEVETGRYCASSCPLMFAGGVERRAGDKAVIGVHQVFAAQKAEATVARDEMGDAQRITARCQRYLSEMGIDLQVWVHAMETPKDRLYILKPDELKSLRVVTSFPATIPAASAPATPTAARKDAVKG